MPAQPPVTVTALYQLNELADGLLVACAADGAVRVWRNYTRRGHQRLATAWQSVLVASQVRGWWFRGQEGGRAVKGVGWGRDKGLQGRRSAAF